MTDTTPDGLARIQSQSRIAATQWRDWCTSLHITPTDAVEVWDEICFPMALVSRSVPDVAYILQLRAARCETDIEDFKEEIPAALHLNAFLGSLQDEARIGAKYRNAVYLMYQKKASEVPSWMPPAQFARLLVVDLCTAVLLARTLPGANISFAKLVRVLVEGQGTLDSLGPLALKAVTEEPYAEKVAHCLAIREALLNPPADAPAGEEAAAQDQEDQGRLSLEETAEFEDEAAGGDGEREDDAEEDEDEGEDEEVAPNPADEFLTAFRVALEAVYDAESRDDISQPAELLPARQRALSQFDPMRSRIPSLEEAQNLAKRAGLASSKGRERALRAGSSGGGGIAAAGGGKTGGSGPVMMARKSAQARGERSVCRPRVHPTRWRGAA